jgi:hypothetical protein
VIGGPRLRQVALVARDCGQVASQLRHRFGWNAPFHDPGVAEFGLTNAVFAVGDTFIEIVAPARERTTAGRYLERRGGEGGYMAIFQVPDWHAARERVAALGIRAVWSVQLADMAGIHLHPKDVPGAIVSLDWAEPAESWRWAGPNWIGGAPQHAPGGVKGLTIEVKEPVVAAQRWAAVLGLSQSTEGETPVVALPSTSQRLRFVPAPPGRGEGITDVTIAGLAGEGRVGGVRFGADGDERD